MQRLVRAGLTRQPTWPAVSCWATPLRTVSSSLSRYNLSGFNSNTLAINELHPTPGLLKYTNGFILPCTYILVSSQANLRRKSVLVEVLVRDLVRHLGMDTNLVDQLLVVLKVDRSRCINYCLNLDLQITIKGNMLL